NHTTAPIDVREKYALSSERVREILTRLKPYATEAVFLSTCNRVEFYLTTDKVEEALAQVRQSLSLIHKLKPQEVKKYFYFHEDLDAFFHLFRVASSLDSMVLGEAQILGQVKDAYEEARAAGMTGGTLNGLFSRAFRAAKKVRTQTEIARMPTNVSSVAISLAKKIFNSLSEQRVLLLGAGEMIELTARYLADAGVSELLIANRTVEKAQSLSEKLGGKAFTLSEGLQQLDRVDILVTSVGGGQVLLSKTEVEKAMKTRNGKPLFIIDIGVPRNVDPEVGQIESVYLYNIDNLSAIADGNRAQRQKAVEAAQIILQEEVDQLCSWLTTLELVPTVVRLRDRFETIRQSEWEEFARKNQSLPEKERKAVERLTRDIVGKLLHDPSARLKNVKSEADQFEFARMLNELFSLMDPTEKE
ncbi:MAG TPA: glutamyl-tRNA reductase, partial [bacterium]